MKNLIKLAVLALIFSGCASNHIDHYQSKRHFVRYGETIIFIAWRYGIDHQDLINWNNLTNEGLIYPGQVLDLEQPQNYAQVNRKKYNENKTTAIVIKESSQTNHDGWDLPTKGKIISKYNSDSSTLSGIIVDGVIGQDILASSSGEVVYAGNDLPGYGQLIIIKHSETFLSAYGYNQDIYVNEGQNVTKGQKIASMGLNSNQVPCLYFEIRRSGKPIDPLMLVSSS